MSSGANIAGLAIGIAGICGLAACGFTPSTPTTA